MMIPKMLIANKTEVKICVSGSYTHKQELNSFFSMLFSNVTTPCTIISDWLTSEYTSHHINDMKSDLDNVYKSDLLIITSLNCMNNWIEVGAAYALGIPILYIEFTDSDTNNAPMLFSKCKLLTEYNARPTNYVFKVAFHRSSLDEDLNTLNFESLSKLLSEYLNHIDNV